MKRKDLLLQEVWRVLKKGGRAFLNIDSAQDVVPDFLDYENQRFILYKNSKLYPFNNFIQDLRKSGYDITYKRTTEYIGQVNLRRHNLVLFVHKNSNTPLELKLTLDEASTFDLNRLGQNHVYWGYRSVYKVVDALYKSKQAGRNRITVDKQPVQI